MLQEIDGINWEFARRLLHCVAVVSRPLRVEELAEFLAFDFDVGQIPKYHKDWRLEDPIDAVLSTCSTLLSPVNSQDSQVIQFSHFSVKEFLTSTRFAEKCNMISSRYHVSMIPAHALVAKACLGILLHLGKDITRDTLPKFPLAEYAAKHWFEHAHFEGVSEDAEEGMTQMFDWRKHHLAVWLWIYDPTFSWNEKRNWEKPLLIPYRTPLHYAAFCGLYDVVKVLTTEHPQDVNSRSVVGEETPLHLASQAGHIDVARLFIEYGTDVAAQTNDGTTPLHTVSSKGLVDVARLLIKHGADAAAQSKDGITPLHQASRSGHMDVVQLLIEHGAYTEAQCKDGTPLHWASEYSQIDVAQLLIEHGANVAAESENAETPLHRAASKHHADLAWLLIKHSADAAAQDEDLRTPLHWASLWGDLDLAQLLIEHGADTAAQDEDRITPLHWASKCGQVDVVRLSSSMAQMRQPRARTG